VSFATFAVSFSVWKINRKGRKGKRKERKVFLAAF
jgi:predicted permease